MTGASPPALIQVEGLAVHYGPVQAVRDARLDVGRGEIVALLGANGAGKTSVLAAIMGLAPVTAGLVRFDGAAIHGRPTERIVRLGLTLVPEGRRVFPKLTVAENLRLGAAARRRHDGAAAALDRVYGLFPVLAERRSQDAGTLSGGEQQQLAIARALMSDPKALLLDEPSLGLAPRIVDAIFDLIPALRAAGLTILLVEQNVELALAVADRGYGIAGGRIVLEGTAAQLRASGGLERAYLGLAG